MKVQLFKVVSEGFFELPKKCPWCKAPFTGRDSALQEWFLEESGWFVEIDKGELDILTDPDGGDRYDPTAYWCTSCDRELALKPVKKRKTASRRKR